MEGTREGRLVIWLVGEEEHTEEKLMEIKKAEGGLEEFLVLPDPKLRNQVKTKPAYVLINLISSA